MSRAALRFAAVVALVASGAGVVRGDPVRHVPPTRPRAVAATATTPSNPAAALAVTQIGGASHFDLEDALARLGLKPKPRDATRKLTFAGKTDQLVLEAESREVLLNGLRIFLGQKISALKGQLYVSKIDYDRCLVPVLRPDLVAGAVPLPKVIAIDAGHGGSDDGMENPRLGMKEKTYTLDVALRVQKLLQPLGYKIVMTRTTDRELAPEKANDLRRRYEIANSASADLFVSIHFNALERDTTTRGVEIFTFTRQFQRSDQSWGAGQVDDAETERASVNRFDPWSALAAHLLHREVIDELKTPDRGQKTKHLLALRGLECPAVLVESAFLTNDTDAKLVGTPAYRQQIAQAIVDGIQAYSATLQSLRPKSAAGTSASSGTSTSR